MKPKRAVIGLAFAALFFAVLLPPEAYPEGKVAVIICATFAFLTSLIERRIPPGYIHGGLAAFASLILHSVSISMDSYRSLEFVSVLWVYYCLLGFFLYAGFDPVRPLAISIVVLGMIVSGYGLYQYFWGFDEIHSYVTYAGSDQVLRVPALERIASKRVFSTLALPGTLWGFLTIVLPFHAFFWNNRWTKFLVSTAAAMVLATGILTRSFGFLLGLFVLTAAWLYLKQRQLAWRLIPVFLALILIAGAFYWSRQSHIEASNPALLRAKNWITAWTIFAAHPLGTGLNNYGVAYPQYIFPGANETQYAHNTPLQLLSELGYPALIAGAFLLLFGLRAWNRCTQRQFSPCVVVALAIWVTHNMIDINVYFPSLGVVGAVLFGVLLWKPAAAAQPETKTATLVTVGFSLIVLIFSGFAMVSTELQYRAQNEADENRFQDAANTLELATKLMPINSSLLHDSGDINLNLYHKKHDIRRLEIATASFRRAIALSPYKSGPHIGLGLCLASANRVEDALEEIRIAQRLAPDATNAYAIARLLEKRLGIAETPR